MKTLTVIGLVVAFGVTTAVAWGQPGPGRGQRAPLPQAFLDCMKAQGVEKPERGTKPTAEDRAKAKAAFEACKQHLPADVRARIEARQKFRECLQAQGLTKPARGTKPTEEQRAKAKAAFEACKQHLPEAAQARIEARKKFRECMKAQGVEKPARGTRPTEEQREKIRAAREACKQFLPKRG